MGLVYNIICSINMSLRWGFCRGFFSYAKFSYTKVVLEVNETCIEKLARMYQKSYNLTIHSMDKKINP
jgi:hypothetical protein